jgi:hypothetical protein
MEGEIGKKGGQSRIRLVAVIGLVNMKYSNNKEDK